MKVYKMRPDAKIEYATDGSGCFDISFCPKIKESVTILKDGKLVLETGLKFVIPKGKVMLLFSRSGMGFNYNMRLSNCVGVIDSDFRGEVKVALRHDAFFEDDVREYRSIAMDITPGDKIAQAMLIDALKIDFEFIDEDPAVIHLTQRGEKGFGSTGK